ncbi:unnamed protein product [Cuscuta epithymum]|uniref:PB1-like domain-containing protein n=1 Tax=Cuscuta epithymum TaxID=186058 RepID=A0AAV0F2X8_9ASTE|nr:unnamed protein product [Cuscuta epithymum]CAH9129842.1 unnamed protein product [Cuscuta epithymum]
MAKINLSLRFWHGGLFRKTQDALVYVNGRSKFFEIDPDELCWFWLEELTKKCGSYNVIDEIFYLVPGLSLDKGLRKVYNDQEVQQMTEMTEILLKVGPLDLYVLHGLDQAELLLMLPPNVNQGGEGGSNVEEPETTSAADDIDGWEAETEATSAETETEDDVEVDAELEDEGEPEDFFSGGDNKDFCDEEYLIAKNRVKECKNKLFEIGKEYGHV